MLTCTFVTYVRHVPMAARVMRDSDDLDSPRMSGFKGYADTTRGTRLGLELSSVWYASLQHAFSF